MVSSSPPDSPLPAGVEVSISRWSGSIQNTGNLGPEVFAETLPATYEYLVEAWDKGVYILASNPMVSIHRGLAGVMEVLDRMQRGIITTTVVVHQGI